MNIAILDDYLRTARQAADWRRFLAMRARELRRGGRLLTAYTARGEVGTGWEWLLTPLMMYQNYHLVHHLYPTVPFYRYKKAWLAREQFHESHHPAKVRAFQFFRE